jgi:hypothetical protein
VRTVSDEGSYRFELSTRRTLSDRLSQIAEANEKLERKKRSGWPDRGQTGVRLTVRRVVPIYSGMRWEADIWLAASPSARDDCTNPRRQERRKEASWSYCLDGAKGGGGGTPHSWVSRPRT